MFSRKGKISGSTGALSVGRMRGEQNGCKLVIICKTIVSRGTFWGREETLLGRFEARWTVKVIF